MLRHIKSHHCSEQQATDTRMKLGKGCCVASGTKQLRVMKALFDADSVSGCFGTTYLSTSAKLLRDMCHPYIPHVLKIDPEIVLVLDVSGPRYVLESQLHALDYIKRSGLRGTYVTKDFADWCYAEAIILKGKIKTLRVHYIRKAQDSKNKLW